MATATAEARNLPAATDDGHKHKKNALSDGQGRLAWMLLAPTLIVIIVVAGIPVIMSIRESFYATNSGVDPDHRPGGRRREVRRAAELHRHLHRPEPGRRLAGAPWTGSGTRS